MVVYCQCIDLTPSVAHLAWFYNHVGVLSILLIRPMLTLPLFVIFIVNTFLSQTIVYSQLITQILKLIISAPVLWVELHLLEYTLEHQARTSSKMEFGSLYYCM